MAPLDYASLTRPQRLAVFLIVIGPDAAAQVLQHFSPDEIENLCREMGEIPAVPDAVRQEVLAEFTPVVGESLQLTLGGVDYARQALSLAQGEDQAERLLKRMAGNLDAHPPVAMAMLAEMPGQQIFNLLRDEQPQTIAYLLSHLNADKSGEVLRLLAPAMQEEVLERLGTIEHTPRELASKIVRKLTGHFSGKQNPTFAASGGVEAVAELLGRLDKRTSKVLLSAIEQRNATLGAAVRRKLFGFEDLDQLSSGDLQVVLREVDSTDLATAMKAASEGLRETIYSCLSKRAGSALRDEIELLGPVRRRDVDAAQDAIIEVVRRLEEEGTITLDEDDAAMVA